DFALVMWEDVVDAAAVNVERLAQILSRHGRTLDVPAGETFAPRAVPAQNVLRLGALPQCEVERVALLATHSLARAGLLRLNAPVRQLAVVRGFGDVEINAAVHLVG